jgi:glutamate-ammonia-ligase adenylyltransferase
VQGLLYAAALSPSELQELWQMRLRIQNERDVVAPPERAFKVCAGGLVEIEFLVQWMQLLHGPQHPRLRTPSTREGLRHLVEEGVMAQTDGRILGENYVFLKRLELAVRRDDFRPISILPQDLRVLARWLGVSSPEQLMADHQARLSATRKSVLKLLFPNGAAHPTMV